MAKTHGLSHTRAHKRWLTMRRRCYDRNFTPYPYYGGRGIKVCDRWHSFENFYADMGECPEGYTLERKDNDEDYSPDNCEWIPATDQPKTRRYCQLVTINGRTMNVADWAREIGFNKSSVHDHLSRGRAREDAIRRIAKTKGVAL